MCMDLKLRVAICDDEKYFREEIKRLVEQYLKEKKIIFCIDLFTSGLEFCSDDNNLQQYDIIFLDIGMKEMNGMETAYAIREKNHSSEKTRKGNGISVCRGKEESSVKRDSFY